MELFYFNPSEEEQKKLGDFIKSNASAAGAEFSQSFEWGEFLEVSGAEILRVGVKKSAGKEWEILLAATLVKKKIGGKFFYYYAPRGPIYKQSGNPVEVLEFLFQEIKKLNEPALFLRFEILEFKADEFKKIASPEKPLLFKKTINLQPAKTLLLDLKKSTEELLKEMHQKTRYNIRLAEKHGVVIKEGKADELKEFWRLLKTTGERDNFRLHPFSHYEKLMALNNQAPGFIKLYFAQVEGKNIAAGIFSFYGDKVTYLHGASDNEFRNLMSPYLLQWSLIKYAQAAGYLYYDFYGIDEKKWPGVTRFKTGFGGYVFEYSGTSDLVFKPVIYRVYEFLRKLRRLI